MRLKKNYLEKHRYDKYSKGSYKIINKFLHYYLVIPLNYNKQEYKEAMERREFVIQKYFTTPIYFRKGYEMRKVK